MNIGFVSLEDENDDFDRYLIYRPGTIDEELDNEILGRTWGDDHNDFETKEDEVKQLIKIITEIQDEIKNGKRSFLEVTEQNGEFINFYHLKNNLMEFFEPHLEDIDNLYSPSMDIEGIKSLTSNEPDDLPEIIESYLNTEFLIEDINIKIKNGKTHEQLAEYLKANNKKNFCIITAHNPYPEVFTEEENDEKNEELEEKLKTYDKIKVLGLSTSDDHPDEASFLVFDIDLETAMNLMQEFDQLAIVYGDKDVTSLIVNPYKTDEMYSFGKPA
jgi:hypothetical protein